jgi:hypothetical protein
MQAGKKKIITIAQFLQTVEFKHPLQDIYISHPVPELFSKHNTRKQSAQTLITVQNFEKNSNKQKIKKLYNQAVVHRNEKRIRQRRR